MKRTCELEDGTIGITQSEQHKRKRLNKINRASGTGGTIIKNLTLISLDSQNERKKKTGLKRSPGRNNG